MERVTISKDGENYSSIPADPEFMKRAEEKGFKPYLDMTKDGVNFITIPASKEYVDRAQSKGYFTGEAYKNKANMPASEHKAPGMGDSFAQGAVDAGTLYFDDEAAGALAAGGKALGGDFNIKDNYRNTRDMMRKQQDESREENPWSYFTGSMVPAIAAGRAGVQGFKSAVGLGGAMGFGDSKAETPLGLATDTATGAVVGGATHGALSGISYLGGKMLGPTVGKVGKWAVKKTGYNIAGVPETATERYINDPAGMKAALLKQDGGTLIRDLHDEVTAAYQEHVANPTEEARLALEKAKEVFRKAQEMMRDAYDVEKERLGKVRPPEELGPQIKEADQGIARDVSEGSAKAFDVLEKLGIKYTRNQLTDIVDTRMNSLMADGQPPKIGPAAKAYSELGKIRSMLEGPERPSHDAMLNVADNRLGAVDLKKIVQQIDMASEAAYARPGEDFVADTMANTRKDIDHELLKHPEVGSGDFKAVMKDVSHNAEFLGQLRKVFGTHEKIAQNIRLVSRPDSAMGKAARAVMDRLDNERGTNLLPQIDEYLYAQGLLKSPSKMRAMKQGMPEFQGQEAAAGEVANAEKGLGAAKDFQSQFGSVQSGISNRKVASMESGNSFGTEDQLALLGRLAGKDFPDRVNEAWAAKQFRMARPAGSKFVKFMSMVLPGSQKAAGLIGLGAEKQGGALWQMILDMGLGLGKYTGLLQKAMTKGPAQLIVTHRHLIDTDPVYKKMFQDAVIQQGDKYLEDK